jgi:Transglycosylase SLT domain
MSEKIAPLAAEHVRAAIARGAQATGVDFSLLVETARRESALNPSARAGTSSATGLFQFIDSTWLDMVRRHGGNHGLGAQAAALSNGADAATRRDILALRNDPELSARMAGELARENALTLQARLGRPPGPGELYAAHVMGAGGALRLIEAAANGAPSAAAMFPREAAANRGLFYANGEARSAQAQRR